MPTRIDNNLLRLKRLIRHILSANWAVIEGDIGEEDFARMAKPWAKEAEWRLTRLEADIAKLQAKKPAKAKTSKRPSS